MAANFIKVDSIEKLDDLFAQSHKMPVVFFKHSSTCGISAGVKDIVSHSDLDLNVVIVQTERDLSNEIAARTNILHQSPQAIVISDGRAIYHASHYDITAQDIENAISAAASQNSAVVTL
jgi:bacillithiol system protein YtxJ